MNVMLTGGDGFLGSWLADELLEHGHNVHALPGPNHGVDLLRAGETAQLLDTYRTDVLVHLAARVGRAICERDPLATVLDNAGMTVEVARACADAGVRLAYVSTSEIYGDCGELPAVDDDPNPLAGTDDEGVFHLAYDQAPANLYGLSKRWGEEAARLYCENPIILRPSMPYGPGHRPGFGRAALTNFLWDAMHGRPLQVHRGAERSWCWVGDTVRGMRMVLEAASVGVAPGAWNIGRDDNATPMRVVAELALGLAGSADYQRGQVKTDELIREVEPPPAQTVVKRLSCARLRRLGWEPTIELAEGMERVYDWLVQTKLEALEQAELARLR